MRKLIVLGVVGLIAQLIDGSLGMAYGVTSTTLLVAAGIAPAAASASVHFAEIGTTLASGVSHHKLGNVDWRIVRTLAIPGASGAFAGATILSNLPADVAKPVVGAILLALGLYVLYRFLALGGRRPEFKGRVRTGFLVPDIALSSTNGFGARVSKAGSASSGSSASCPASGPRPTSSRAAPPSCRRRSSWRRRG